MNQASAKDITSLPLKSFIKEPLMAAGQAQIDAATGVMDYVMNDCMKVEKLSDGSTKTTPVEISFGYSKTSSIGMKQQFNLTVPLLCLMPMPCLRMDEVSVSFMCKLQSKVDTKVTSEQISMNSSSGVVTSSATTYGFNLKINSATVELVKYGAVLQTYNVMEAVSRLSNDGKKISGIIGSVGRSNSNYPEALSPTAVALGAQVLEGFKSNLVYYNYSYYRNYFSWRIIGGSLLRLRINYTAGTTTPAPFVQEISPGDAFNITIEPSTATNSTKVVVDETTTVSSFNAMAVNQRVTTEGSTVTKEFDYTIQVKAVSDPLPPGLEKLLEVFAGAIKDVAETGAKDNVADLLKSKMGLGDVKNMFGSASNSSASTL